MIVTFITFADTFEVIKKDFPDIIYSEQDNGNISVTIELSDGLDAWKLFSAGINYGADRIINSRTSGQPA